MLERNANTKGRVFGVMSMMLGLFALGMAWLRQLYLRDDWMALAIGVFGILSLCGGAFMTIRFYFTARALTEMEKEVDQSN